MTLIPDLVGFLAAMLTTVSFLPQAILTIKTRNTESLSLGMYSTFTLGVLLWLVYGYHKQDYAIIAANLVTLILSGFILSFKIHNTIKNRK